MEKPVVAQYKPYFVDVTEGERYLWCSCGLSKNQPWCDQSHVGTPFKPVRYVAEKTTSLLLCGCKQTGAAPFCDGTHNNLVDEYEEDPRPLDELLANTSEITADATGRALLDGGCFVQRPADLGFMEYGAARIAPVIDSAAGARFLAQYYIELAPGKSGPLTFSGAEVVLFGLDGDTMVDIAGHKTSLQPEAGVFIREGEGFALHNSGPEPAHLLATVCPAEGQLSQLPDLPHNFDGALPERTVARDDSKRNTMADRFYQVLVGEECGSREITQFIGQVPKSKAAPHHHLYEEAIVILSGDGVMWTENLRTPVSPGDMIFLPARQQHSLQCTSDNGMILAGHFYPSGSPAINY